MKTYYECKVKYMRVSEINGLEKLVSEIYLIDAINYSEAEVRMIDELNSMTSGLFKICHIRPSNYAEIIGLENGDRYYSVRVKTVLIDDVSGSEKKVITKMLVCASSVEDATICTHKALENSTTDHTILTVSETAIVEVIIYDEQTDDGDAEV